MKTLETYHEHDFRKEWSTRILGIKELEKGYGILLEKSAFYPGGGGQPCDCGWINGMEVKEVYREGDAILHLVEEEPTEKETALCRIHRERRLDLMQQHSGQHLLSAVFYTLMKGQTSSFHLGLDYVTIDISIPDMAEEWVEKVEDQVNQYIYENRPIKHYLVSPEELAKLPLRKQPKVQEDIRVVEIQGVDIAPCGGTHLDSTGQLGILKIIRTENYKGNTRVYFKAGRRALEDFQTKSQTVHRLSSLLSSGEEELVERVEKELKKGRNLSRDLNHWKERTAYWESRDLIANSQGSFIAKLFEDKDFEEMERISNQIHLQGDFVLLLASKLDGRIILSHSGQPSIHCGKTFKELLPQYEGRGGGSDRKAQAAFSSREKLVAFYHHLQERIE